MDKMVKYLLMRERKCSLKLEITFPFPNVLSMKLEDMGQPKYYSSNITLT